MNGFEKFYICALATLAVGNPNGACSLKVCCLRTDIKIFDTLAGCTIRLQSNNTDGTLTSIGTFIKRTVVLKRPP